MFEKDKIKNITSDFFEKMGFDIDFQNISVEDNLISVKIKTQDPQVLIGKNGQILNDIQHILSRLLKKEIQENFYLALDINDYKTRKIEYLKDLARDLADEVSLTKREKSLWPMPAQERRIIHLELANRTDIFCKSEGEGENRRIVVRPS